MTTSHSPRRVLLIGASRGLGYAMAEEFLDRGWHVLGTVRQAGGERLRALAASAGGRLAVETVDITQPDEVAALRERLAGQVFDLLFVNAGVTNDRRSTIGDVATEEFVRVLVTNTLSPMRVIERLQDLVTPEGTIAVMSSGLGSVANNVAGGYEVYRASKAGLNTLMRCYAARTAGSPRTLLVLAPGWVRTDMGGAEAPLGIADSIPNLVSTIEARAGEGGLHYLDYLGRTVPW